MFKRSKITSLLESIGIDHKPNNKLTNLLQVPTKDKGKNIPSTQVFKKNSVHQADLLELPNDDGYKYLLVVIDLATRAMDAEPLKSKSSSHVVKAIKTIYKRKHLNYPKDFMQTDQGTEFKSSFKDHFDDKKIFIKYTKSGRHRQNAYVEWMNGIIGEVLNARMAGEELLLNETSRQWVDDIKPLITAINKAYTRPEDNSISKPPRCKGKSCKLLKRGLKVRIILDEPKEMTTGKRLHGKFRKSDMRWENKDRKIEQVLIRPDQPPTYLVTGIKNTAYTRNQLQIIPEDEELPAEKILRRFKIEKILNRRKKNNRIEYKVKWVGFTEPTWEKRTELMKDIPDQIKAFDRSIK